MYLKTNKQAIFNVKSFNDVQFILNSMNSEINYLRQLNDDLTERVLFLENHNSIFNKFKQFIKKYYYKFFNSKRVKSFTNSKINSKNKSK